MHLIAWKEKRNQNDVIVCIILIEIDPFFKAFYLASIWSEPQSRDDDESDEENLQPNMSSY